ncbi:J domain-containing protein 1 [Kalmusia sp. IMI 367209]|nr:J domain-containing protein 1 [Kalmusia sp. IMI 367209]
MPPHTRTYAQHVPASDASDASDAHCGDADLAWPEAEVPHRSPTPYQILGCSKRGQYTKHRFYSLVKLYHPDRCATSSPIAHLPHAVRLERYRLLVAAHTILSDDAKRKAYDTWGLGWPGHHHHTPARPPQHTWASEQRQWTYDPRYNATWEDWERWYQRESGTEGAEPRALYMTNFAFVSLIFAIVTLGGIMQGTRANVLTSSAMEHSQRIHREASMELARSKRATMSGDRNERIRTFLEHREAVHAGEDAYHRLLPPADTCAPDTVRKH